MGRLTASVVFASETCALDIVGATYEREVEPGEIVAVDADGDRSAFPLEKKELKRCVFEYVYFARPDSRIFGGSVDRARRALGRQLAKEHPRRRAPMFSVPDSAIGDVPPFLCTYYLAHFSYCSPGRRCRRRRGRY